MDKMIVFEIPLTKKEIGKYSLNNFYAGMHSTERTKIADYFHSLVQHTLLANKIPKILFKNPVKITIYYNSNLDIDGHGVISKLIVDSMKGYLLINDTRKYFVNLEQEFWNGNGIRVEVVEINEENLYEKYK
jgi:hypothetical protein